VYINQGLLAIGKVVQAMSTNKKSIPFRDSVLTVVLQDCLNFNSFFTLLGCISPSRKNKLETLSTIRFAQSCKFLDSKILPEVNAYLKERERLNAKTPLKSYMIPSARNEFQSNKKTPMNKRNISEFESIKKRDCGTIKKQPFANSNRFNSFITPRSVAIKQTPMRRTDIYEKVTTMHDTFSLPQNLDNNTFSIMNASTSTEVGESTLPETPFPSFSPLMRKIEMTIDKKLNTFMETLQNTTTFNLGGEILQSFKFDLVDEINGSVMNSIQESFSAEKTVLEVQNNDKNQERVKHFTAPTTSKRTNRRLVTNDLTQCPTQIETKKHQPRRSIRISLLQAARENKDDKNVKPINVVEPLRNKRLKKNIFAYYQQNLTDGSSKNVSKKDHRTMILNLINCGSIRELQQLPTIGEKTAHQIVVHRAIKGKFQKLDDVKEGLKMKDIAWNKFLEVNQLIY
jgi:Kinesin motor domain/Helix-hairpin-helix motif